MATLRAPPAKRARCAPATRPSNGISVAMATPRAVRLAALGNPRRAQRLAAQQAHTAYVGGWN